MSDVHEIELTGCTPEPLMSYLKSLGIIRLVSEQVDPGAVGCWRNDHLLLRSKMDEKGLLRFLREEYRPTPIIGPWAGGSGFFGNDNRKAVDTIVNSESPRAEHFQKVVKRAKHILSEHRVEDKPTDDVKSQLLQRYRREMPDEFVQWMDAAMVLHSEGQTFAPVLGTGGNDGRLDFTQNFMQRIVELKLFDTKPSTESETLLDSSLIGCPVKGLGKAKVGQFSPGRAGGPNATQGMEGGSTDNPWDFILMLEGALMLAGSVVRRLGVSSTDRAAFPFTVRARPVGEGAPTEEDLGGARGELWLPVWDRWVSLAELQTLFAEGRAELSGRLAHDAIDFAQAVAGLGIDRGVRSFARYGFLKRSGKAYLATAMDRFRVPDRPRDAMRLLQRIDAWLVRFRREATKKQKQRFLLPRRFRTALRRIESAIFDYCRYGRREDMLAVLVALGRAERELALTGGQRGSKEICRAIGGLSPQWITATYDGSAEYDLALAMAGIHDRGNKIDAIRSNIEPVVWQKGRWALRESGPHIVWNCADLPTNMTAVLTRRMMDGKRAGCEGLPLSFERGVSSDAVASFIAAEVDDRRIEELLWGLMLIDHRRNYLQNPSHAEINNAPPLPREYALLKLLFLPRPLVREWNEKYERWNWRLARQNETGILIRPEPRVLPLLRSRRVAEACRIAYQRLRASGFKPLLGPKSTGVWRGVDWEPDPSLDPQRLAAALLLPTGDFVVNQLIHLVTRQDEDPEPEILVAEGAIES